MVESSDGSIKVVELDPTKWYWVIAESGSLVYGRVEKRDGLILYTKPGSKLTFIENADRVEEIDETL